MENLGKVLQEKMKSGNMLERYNLLVKKALSDDDVRSFLLLHKDKLTQEDVKKSISKLYEYVKIKENIAQGKEIPMPGYFPSLVISNHRIEVNYVPTVELMAQRERIAMQNRVRTIKLPKSLRQARLDTYEQTYRQDALKAAAAFILAYQKHPKMFHKALYLHGAVGVGKTYLLAAIANKLAEDGFESVLVHFPSFAVEMKSSIGSNVTKQLLDDIKNAPILMLDDIGAEQLSSWLRDDILGVILQHRMQEELPTFFSSNLPMEQLEREYLTINNRGEAEPLKAKRIMERIRFLATECLVGGPNRRNPEEDMNVKKQDPN
ncbi:primosomal protein DnaI [Ligilactobacillus agilis]|uniref:primosomal protein DnaI n=1 Tax=Ligilactobacillus agilis TaxID=1601 RepID=UPI0025A36689|nr:primosomal protein DnaI [Ligilactobacillus agilis]MDM8279139.1 primosomal protein DnaI [Ligilactobacillus agilis]